MALLLTYMEVWPECVLSAVFGDLSRLWEYDPDEKTKTLNGASGTSDIEGSEPDWH